MKSSLFALLSFFVLYNDVVVEGNSAAAAFIGGTRAHTRNSKTWNNISVSKRTIMDPLMRSGCFQSCRMKSNDKDDENRISSSLTVKVESIWNQMSKGLTSFMILCSIIFNTPDIDIPNFQSVPNENHPVSIVSAFQFQIHPNIPTAQAVDYGSLSEEQKAVAEAWRVVDNTFIDRTFNHQDWFQMRQDIVQKKKYKNINEAREAIATMMSSLGDKYTRYLPPDKYQSIVDSATGTLAGIGVEIGTAPATNTGANGRVQANDVEEKSPAQIAGIQPLDIFLQVDGINVEQSTPDEVAQLVRGPIGTKVGVVMERNGKAMDFIIARDKITVTSVKSYLSDSNKNIGVIRIKSFSGTTSQTVSETLQALQKKGAKSFVIDIRSNPGGLLPGGVDTASLFLEENKPVVFVVNKNGVVDAQRTLTTGMDLASPLVLFVNDQTASASEVFAAALQENARATIVGEGSDRTFGKGIVQTIRELSNGNGGVAVTIARYETPLHNDINKKGIEVNVKVDSCTNTKDAVACIPTSAFRNPTE